MTDDLVKRLRSANDESFVETLCGEAADHIEQLTAERDASNELGKALEEDSGQLREEVARLNAERDRLQREVKDLKKLAYAAYCEGFSDGKDGGWIVGPSNQPWKASDAHRMLKTMEAKP